VSLLDPDDRAYADEQEYDAGSNRGEGTPDEPELRCAHEAGVPCPIGCDGVACRYGDPVVEPVEGTVGLDVPDGVMPDGTDPGSCPHPMPDRRLYDGQQVCARCWEVLDAPTPAILPVDRPGAEDPTMRTSDGARAVGLRHVTYVDGQAYADRPYTPEQIELEIVGILSRIERGAGFQTTKVEECAAAKLEYDLAYARALIQSTARSKELREAQAMLTCREQYERWKLLELTVKTTSEGMHNLRSMLSGFQSVARSIGVSLGAAR
jgi:hypothetical protein